MNITETELRVKPTDSKAERCLKIMARIDWKAMAIVLAALAGLGGAIWNRVDAITDKVLASRTQQGVYDLLAQRMDTIDGRLATVEAALAPKPVQPPSGPEHGRPVMPQPAAPEVVTPDKTVALPPFETIRQSAAQDRMPELLDAIAK